MFHFNQITIPLGLYKKLFKNTAIYGPATVIPRMFSFLLVPIYTQLLPREEYGQVTIIFSWMIFFNVILAYGMETSFFRFYNKETDKNKVVETSTVSIFTSSLFFLALSLLFRNTLAAASGINVQYITYTIWILVLDAFVIVPFSNLRAQQKPGLYALLKVGNVVVNLSLNLFFSALFTQNGCGSTGRVLGEYISRKFPNRVYFYFQYFGQFGYFFSLVFKLYAPQMGI